MFKLKKIWVWYNNEYWVDDEITTLKKSIC